jgi:uncharacterized protein
MTAVRSRGGDQLGRDPSSSLGVLTASHPRGAGVAAWVRRHDLGVYFFLAFSLSWLPWPLVALNPESSPMVPFGPLIAAVVVTALSGGRRSLGQLLAQLARWRSPTRWYAVALLIPLTITGLAAATTSAVGGSIAFRSGPEWTQIAATFISAVVLIGVFEEVGWRGYALPRLLQKMTGLRAALVIGVIWASWHLPELVSDPTRQRPVVQFVIIVIAQSVFLSWLYISTAGALPIVIISHATIDTVVRFILPNFTQGSYQLIWWCQAGLWTAVAILVATVRAFSPHHRRRVDAEAAPVGSRRLSGGVGRTARSRTPR